MSSAPLTPAQPCAPGRSPAIASVRRLRWAWLLVPITALAQAQAPAPATSAAAVPPPAAASAPAVAMAASAPASAVTLAVPAAPPPPRPSCAQLTDQAMAADMKAATLQSQRGEPSQLARLFDSAIGLWQQAVDECQGRGRDRAQRNLADDQKVRASLGELLGSGEHCAASQRDANTLQELARQAAGERRWLDAASLYRKSENTWDLAAERCSGAQQQLAQQRRDQVAVDGHNAEFCAPRFDRAREFNQKLRATAPDLAPPARQTQQQIAETLWREAVAQCKGPALDLARSNAQVLARERGTPWVATLPPAVVPAPAGRAAPVAAAASGTLVPTAALATTAAPAPRTGGAAQAAAAMLSTALAAGATAMVPEAPKPLDIALDGGTRLNGLFARAPDGLTYTGRGKIAWPNGDRYDGEVLAGKRHGHGEFIWANGQRFSGDWVDDRPEGQGVLHFANGNVYEGAVVDGQPQGRGKMIQASGDVYTGLLDQGTPHGQGTYLWASGQRYEGPWVRGQAEGRATMGFANGNSYEGDVVNGLPQGRGKLRFASGDVYDGELQQGRPDGQGSYAWKTGDRYVGQWKAGQKEGNGVMSWTNGDRWEGVFRADAQTEQGQLIRKKP